MEEERYPTGYAPPSPSWLGHAPRYQLMWVGRAQKAQHGVRRMRGDNDSEMPYPRRTGANTLFEMWLRNVHLDFAGRQLHLQELPDVLQLL